jgi:hypothetical protein
MDFDYDDLSDLLGDTDNWQPMDIDGLTEDPWLSMVMPPDTTGLGNVDGTGSLSDFFNIGNGGISGMDPGQYASLFGNMANTLRPAGATNGYAANGGLTAAQILEALKPSPLAQALNALGAVGGAFISRNATNDATQQAVGAINSASDQVKQILGGAQANYTPYMQAGTTALAKLANAAPSNIAGMFGPLGSGRGLQMSSAPAPGFRPR